MRLSSWTSPRRDRREHLHFRHLFNPFEHYMSSDSTLLTFDIPCYSTFCTIRPFFHLKFCPIRLFFHSTFCPVRLFFLFDIFSIRRFLLFNLLSHSTLVPFNVLYHSAFFPFDVLSHSAFCLSTFWRSTFCTFGVCYFDILSVNQFSNVKKMSRVSFNFYNVFGLNHCFCIVMLLLGRKIDALFFWFNNQSDQRLFWCNPNLSYIIDVCCAYNIT
jgi:hypothetical protein